MEGFLWAWMGDALCIELPYRGAMVGLDLYPVVLPDVTQKIDHFVLYLAQNAIPSVLFHSSVHQNVYSMHFESLPLSRYLEIHNK